jgi:hypothetical protein
MNKLVINTLTLTFEAGGLRITHNTGLTALISVARLETWALRQLRALL